MNIVLLRGNLTRDPELRSITTGDKQTSVLYIDSPCFTQDIDSCRNYSEIRILPDMSLQPCILRSSGTKILDLSKGEESIRQQFREAWKSLKNC